MPTDEGSFDYHAGTTLWRSAYVTTYDDVANKGGGRGGQEADMCQDPSHVFL